MDFIAPGIDMVNHDSFANVSTAFCHLELEKVKDQTVLESKGYKPLKASINLSPFIAEDYGFEATNKSHLLRFAEVLGKTFPDHQRMTLDEERRLALVTMKELIHRDDPKIEIWDLPYLLNVIETEDKKAPSKYEGPGAEQPQPQPVTRLPEEDPFKQLMTLLGKPHVEQYSSENIGRDNDEVLKKWYNFEDPAANFIMFNKANKVIPAGSQITFLYSEYGNMDLCLAYGFALSENRFDWLRWRQEKEGTLKWRLYMHTLCMDGIRGIRMLIMRTGRTDKFEIETMLLTTYTNSVNKMLSHLKRSDAQTQKILDNPKISHHQKNIVLVERSWKQILLEHVRMMKYLTAVLEKVKANPTGDFKQMYMETVPGVDAEQDPEGLLKVELRHKVREYLKELNEAIPLPKAS